MAKRRMFVICLPLLMWLMLSGFWIRGTWDAISRPWDPGSWLQIRGRVYRQEESTDGLKVYLKNISIFSKDSRKFIYFSDYENTNAVVYLEEKTDLSLGNQVEMAGFCAYPAPPDNPGGFDERDYYYSQNIRLILKKGRIEKNNQAMDYIGQGMEVFREKVKASVYRICTPEDAGVVSAVLLGDKKGLSSEIKDLYQDNGIIHILAISGLHVSLLGMGIYGVLRKLGCSYGGTGMLCGIFMAAYGVLTGLPFSALRAVIMFWLFLGAQWTGRTYDRPGALMVAALIMLAGRPQAVGQAGFLLSFTAVIGVILAEGWKHWLLKRTGLGVSLGVWLMTLPMSAWYFYQVPLYGILLNLLVVPFMPVIMGFGIIGAGAGVIASEAGVFLMAPVHYLLKMITFLCGKIRMIPGAVLVVGRPSVIQILLYYGILLIFLCFLQKKQKISLIHRAFGIILILSIIWYRKPEKWTMTFLNVGQGDGSCIRTPEGTVWMVDGGSSSRRKVARYALEPYLYYHGHSQVDYWLISHFDSDHVNGLEEILESYQRTLTGRNGAGITVRHIIVPETEGKQELREKIVKLAEKHGIPVLLASRGDVIRQKDTVIKILAPQRNIRYENDNASSIVMEVSIGEFRALFTGDVEGEGERQLMERGLAYADLLKVAHHGSRNSTSEEFLTKVNPRAAVISCGKNNLYGHPHQELLKRLEKRDCKVFRTDSFGAVDVTVEEGRFRISEAK